MFSKKVIYKNLNSRQKEIYNFQKVSSIFADYGYTTIKLSDDWMGADFIAISFDGSRHLKVQLKSRLSFAKKYQGKELFICFRDINDNWYIYNHDQMLENYIGKIENSEAWKINGEYNFPRLNDEAKKFLNLCVLR